MEEMWLARDKDDSLFLYSEEKPSKNKAMGVWRIDGTDSLSTSMGYVQLRNHLFPEVQWSDEEPTKVKLEIVK